ncbi:MAG: transcription-repair coupling factor [Oscillospiraceae bacterium]|nr:transcription-repair coupling factor [Oscillospiraceae bacterium]
MKFSDILKEYAPYQGIVKNLNNTPISVAGIVESAQGQLIYALQRENNSSALVVCYSDMEARKMYSDMELYSDNILYFPSKEYIYYNIETSGHQNEYERISVIQKLAGGGRYIVVTSLDAVLQYTADKTELSNLCIDFEIGKRFDLEDLTQKLIIMGYSREAGVEAAGQFAIRGGILDIFPPGNDNPYRIEFFDDETDSIREFDAYTQRSLGKVNTASAAPVREAVVTDEKLEKITAELEKRIQSAKRKKSDESMYIETTRADIESFKEVRYFPSIDKYVSLIYDKIPSVLDYFSDNDLVFIIDPKRIAERGKSFEWEKNEVIAELKEKRIIGAHKDKFYCSYIEKTAEMSAKRLISLDVLSHSSADIKYKHLETFTTKTTVSFHGKIEYLYEDLRNWQSKNYTTVILCASRGRGENLAGVLKEKGIKAIFSDGESRNAEFNRGETVIVRGELNKGFEYPEINFVLVSDREIFETKKSRSRRKVENANRIKSYTDISVGDYVVHQTHGIGQYMGTKKMVVGGITKDYLKIRYQGTDLLYIPIDQLNLLYKYVGNADKQMRLNKLGGNEWNKTKQRVKQSTAELAKKLIALYAERENTKGFAYSDDTPWQRDFEDTFPYQETEDQLRSIEEVKADMEKPKPMDRLLCGDVGFGKTEVALRASFKAVGDSKQVAYLCPTTILAMQHYETFLKRMENFPIRVEMLSRFRTASQQKKILKQLKTGEIDIVIGTHRILSKDLAFKDLGLLIIDEEQRFGVAHKERLKELKQNIDVLTMTATPIPRTLHMAMTGVRDMSVLTEPPENRYPVQTYVLEDNPAVIADAIRNEISRGGQVFYLYNRVQGIYAKAEQIKSMFPDINVAVGHGKMKEDELEDIMYDMVNGKTDVLVCTTIIETGLDIPNANTIIIENADKMGLAQLYQLRGRVGRSNRAAYAYLTYHRDKILSEVASKRLRAVKEFTEFGSGFKIAMRDLEIRGAGNILGPEQHGHMDAVGYDMYCKLLKESVDEAQGIKVKEKRDVSIDINIDAYLPESYIENHNQRIDIYKKIAAVETEDDKFEIEDELIDRFGDIPKPVQNIIEVAALKTPAKECGIYEISQSGDTLSLKFEEDYVDAPLIMGLDRAFPKRIKLVSSENPIISYALKGDYKNILKIVNNLLTQIKELQNKEK